MKQLTLTILPDRFAICRLSPDEEIPDFIFHTQFYSITRTDDELSIVLPEEKTPSTWKAEKGWRCLKVDGPLDFYLAGILSSFAAPLANVGISIFTVSTFDTDYILIKEEDLEGAKRALSTHGHIVK